MRPEPSMRSSRMVHDYLRSDGTVRRAYTVADDDYLRRCYATAPREEIVRHLARPWQSITGHAHDILGLARPNIRTHQLAVLLPNTVLNAYWWGFIMADGYISNRGILRVSLGLMDENHLLGLAHYIGKDRVKDQGKGMRYLDACDKINGLALKAKLGITEKKTYNPPDDLGFLQTSQERLAFFVGFSDGDGRLPALHGA